MPAELAPTGTIPGKWRETVVDDHGRLNVISYEICLLTQLRERIRAKEIWIVGADKYRNPDDDLPQDFEERRGAYFKGLGLPQDAQVFIAGEAMGGNRSALVNGALESGRKMAKVIAKSLEERNGRSPQPEL